MKKIAVITTTRAEYGILHPVIKELRKYESKDLKIDLIVSGTHLSKEYGYTKDEIKKAGDRIDHEVLIPVESRTAVDISNNQSVALVKFTDLFCNQQFDAVIILGDRYEMLAVAIAAGNTLTPIFYISGGDTTEGALDEWIRHAITKISYLHFTSNKDSRRRVIQLGEDPTRVFNYGSPSIDNIVTIADISKGEALKSVGLIEYKYALCTYHPVTMESDRVDKQMAEFLNAIRAFPYIEFIVTKSNSDQGGARINELLDEAEGEIKNLHVYTSLGVRRYLSLMKYAEFVLGNSSSGIVETPAFHVPTVNIGDRQKGRLQSESIINCNTKAESIINGIHKALSDEHKAICQKVTSPYGNGRSAERISKKAVETVLNGRIDLKKKFYDLKVE